MAVTSTAPAQSAQVGSLFGRPGITYATEQAENNDGIAVTPKSGAQSPVTSLVPFKQTDVIKAWRMELNLNATYAAGTTTLALSQYFPYNFFGPIKLQYQNQYSPIDVVSGVDAAIFQFIRPYYNGEVTNARNLLDTGYAAFPYNAQTNLVSKSNFTTASTNFYLTLDMPAGLDFDRFWPLDAYGNVLTSEPLRTFVSPQFMSGTARVVQPSITMNGLITSGAGTSDIFPVYGSGTQTTPASVSGVSGTLGFQRIGWYQPRGQQDSPFIYNWQYTRISRQYAINGRTVVDLNMPASGQVLSVFVRLYDPAANVLSTVAYGAPISVSSGTTLTKANLLYGSGFYRFQDSPLRAQERFARQHQATPPEGVLIWDMALNNQGLITNEEVMNTMTTSGITVHLEFSSATSASAYAVVGAELLTYVEPVSA